jgi:hypothetical protein
MKNQQFSNLMSFGLAWPRPKVITTNKNQQISNLMSFGLA